MRSGTGFITNTPEPMKLFNPCRAAPLASCVAALSMAVGRAAIVDDIGLTQLRALDPSLTGSGVNVGQAEADADAGAADSFEVNPGTVGQPASLFSYISGAGTVNGIFPNAVGTESGHADQVGANFYGTSSGVAPGVAHVDNYDASYFYNTIVVGQTTIQAKVVNQSFVFTGLTTLQQQQVEQNYDNFTARYGTLFVDGAGNSGTPSAPSTAYNSIAVGAYGGSSAVGPTSDGRSKPDITAPGSATSFSTPLVSGAAAILIQAGLRGDGGAGTSTTATDHRTVKALLLNGAVKPADWFHSDTQPLDPRYGTGVLNVYNSYLELRGGQHPFIVTTTGSSHAPPTTASNEPTTRGWDLNTIAPSGSPSQDATNHYFFDLTSPAGSNFQFTGTLTWDRQLNQAGITNLDLYFYDALTNVLIGSSVSTVDNVEHLFLPKLTSGRFDLEVFYNGASRIGGGGETYALAFDFAPVPEPTASIMMLTGVIALASRGRRRVSIYWRLEQQG